MSKKELQQYIDAVGEILVGLREESDRTISSRPITLVERESQRIWRKFLRSAIGSLEDGQEALADLRERA